MIKLYYDKQWEQNGFLGTRIYELEDICIQDRNFEFFRRAKRLNRQRYFLHPNTTVADMKRDLADIHD